jgi:hypothetical protein
MAMKTIEDTVVDYPITGQYDINVWCDSEWDNQDRTVSITFYPLIMDDAMKCLVTDTSEFYTLNISLWPRGPKQKAALKYITDLVNEEDTFDGNYTDWWSNESVLVNAPSMIQEFLDRLPRTSQLERFVGE